MEVINWNLIWKTCKILLFCKHSKAVQVLIAPFKKLGRLEKVVKTSIHLELGYMGCDRRTEDLRQI